MIKILVINYQLFSKYNMKYSRKRLYDSSCFLSFYVIKCLIKINFFTKSSTNALKVSYAIKPHTLTATYYKI